MELVNQLNHITEGMAQKVIQWLPHITQESYLQFLDRMYHYTLKSGDRLRWVAEKATEASARSVFQQLAKEESQHYKLAEMDLAAFGVKPSSAEPRRVTEFHTYWNAVPPGRSNEWLGAMYVLENVGSYLQKEARSSLQKLGLKPEQARFVLVHLEEDLNHGRNLAELCMANGEKDLQSLARGATIGADFWVALHQEVLEVKA